MGKKGGPPGETERNRALKKAVPVRKGTVQRGRKEKLVGDVGSNKKGVYRGPIIRRKALAPLHEG